MTKMPATQVAALVLLVSAVSACAADPGVPAASRDAYESVVTMNIFLRQRGMRRADDSAAPAVPSRPPESYMVLRGIVQKGADCIAFWEDVRSGESQVLRAGDAIGAGRLTAVTRDYAEYEANGASKKVAVGETLSGEAGVPSAQPGGPQTTGGSPGPAAATTSSTPASADEASILERLKQRREKEGTK